MKKKLFLVVFHFLLIVIFSSCKMNINAPVVDSFTAMPTILNVGDNVTLTWSVTGDGASVSIDNGVGTVSTSGTSTVMVDTAGSVTFTLTATNEGGTTTATAIVTVESTWSKTFGGTGDDVGRSVQQTSDGGYIVAGIIDTGKGGGTNYNVYLAKLDSSGNETWSESFGGGGSDRGYAVQQTSDGGYIVAGETDSKGAGDDDFYLIKTDSSGNATWEKTFGDTYSDQAYSVQQTTDGGYILVGKAHLPYGAGGNDVLLIKTDSSGNLSWEKSYGNAEHQEGYSVRQTSDEGYIIAGTTRSAGGGDKNVYLIKTDASGNITWEKTIGGTEDDEGASVQQTSDEGYIIAGTTKSSGAGQQDVYLIKTDSSGNVTWEKTFGGQYGDRGYSVCQTSDGDYVVVGRAYSFRKGKALYLVKTDSTGTLVWDQVLGNTEDDAGYSVKQTTSGGYIITGHAETTIGSDVTNILVMKTNSNGEVD